MKKLLVILFVSFLLFAPEIAQAKSEKKCKKDDPSCTVSQDGGQPTGNGQENVPQHVPPGQLDKACKKNDENCTTIQEGDLQTSGGDDITTGYDEWGYNYQARKYSGYIDNLGRSGEPVTSGDYNVSIKWNEAYLSNRDYDKDGELERHPGSESYIGTGASYTNHLRWSYFDEDGKRHMVTWFMKVVAKPTADFNCDDIRGTPVNGEFCMVKSVRNDPYAGYSGLEFNVDDHLFGGW